MLKIVGNGIYAHCSNFDEWRTKCITYMPSNLFDALYQEAFIYYEDLIGEKHFVMKFEHKSESISLISSPDWDIRHEPSVGDGVRVFYDINDTITYKLLKGRGQIYHSKWMFVQPDYTGFNVKISKFRTVQWSRIPNINSLRNKIGYRKFWNEFLKEHKLSL